MEGGNREPAPGLDAGRAAALVVVCVFFVFQQITGINVPLYYGPHLLGPIFAGAHASLVQTAVAGVKVTAIMSSRQRRRHLPGVPVDRQVRPPQARHGRLHRDDHFALVSAVGLAFMSGTPGW